MCNDNAPRPLDVDGMAAHRPLFPTRDSIHPAVGHKIRAHGERITDVFEAGPEELTQ